MRIRTQGDPAPARISPRGRSAILGIIGVAIGLTICGMTLTEGTQKPGSAASAPAATSPSATNSRGSGTARGAERPAEGTASDADARAPEPSNGPIRSWPGGPNPVGPGKFRNAGFPAPATPQYLQPESSSIDSHAVLTDTIGPSALAHADQADAERVQEESEETEDIGGEVEAAGALALAGEVE